MIDLAKTILPAQDQMVRKTWKTTSKTMMRPEISVHGKTQERVS